MFLTFLILDFDYPNLDKLGFRMNLIEINEEKRFYRVVPWGIDTEEFKAKNDNG